MDNLETFRTKEIKNLKNLRIISYLILFTLNLSVILLFSYLFYSAYNERNIEENFILYVGPTILGIQCVIGIPLGLLAIIIYSRFHFAISEISNLNEEYLQRYREYVNSIERAFTGIPPYLFTKRGIIIQYNFSQYIYPPDTIDKLKIVIVHRGGLARNHIIFFQNNKKKGTLTFLGFQKKRLEFIKSNVEKENPCLIIEENIESNWW